MTITFATRLEAIDWIATYAEDEGQFEALREKLHFNFIYSGKLFLNLEESPGEIVLMDPAAR